MAGPRGSATQRTALFARQQPGGFWNTASMDKQPGNIWFVDSTHASATDGASYGRNPDRPFATLDYAVGQCTASNGDIIYLLPDHAETYSTAGGLDLDVKGIKIMGLGWGETQPAITLDTLAAADIDVDASSITIENVHFIAGVADIVAYFDVAAESCVDLASVPVGSMIHAAPPNIMFVFDDSSSMTSKFFTPESGGSFDAGAASRRPASTRPGTGRSISRCVASGVTSRGARPVPPAVTISAAPGARSRKAPSTESTPSGTTRTSFTTKPSPSSSC